MLIVDKLAFQEKLSEGEKTLAAYILAHGMEIAKYSTRSLAEVTYTSPPTVLRLCKKLGFTGFDDFKQNFVRELEYLDQQQGKVDFNFPFAENDSPMRVAQNIGELYEEAVKDTMQLLRYEDLHKAVLLLKYHEEIHIFSAGTAINQAESFREKMLKIGKRVVIFNNLNYQRYQACCLSERDLAMIISYSGETAQMLEIARQCKRSGTPKMKCSDSASKAIIPGKKMPWRLYDENGQAQCDLIAMDDEVIEAGKPVTMVNLDSDAIERTVTITPTKVKKLLVPHVLNGQLAIELPSIAEKKAYIAKQLTEETWESELRLECPHKHYVNMTPAVAECRSKMYAELHGGKV